MKTVNSRTASAIALAAFAAMLHTAPASAMGHAGIPASMAGTGAQATERKSQTEDGTQAQIDALRKEMAELKARMAMASATGTGGTGQ